MQRLHLVVMGLALALSACGFVPAREPSAPTEVAIHIYCDDPAQPCGPFVPQSPPPKRLESSSNVALRF